MKQILMTFAVPILAGALASCAAAQEGTDQTASGEEPGRCMFVRNIDNYHPIDRNHVVISDRGEHTFLLGTMRPGCWDIMHSIAIGLDTAPISLCAGQTATLLVGEDRCYIRTLEAVPSLEAAEALVEARAGEEDDS